MKYTHINSNTKYSIFDTVDDVMTDVLAIVLTDSASRSSVLEIFWDASYLWWVAFSLVCLCDHFPLLRHIQKSRATAIWKCLKTPNCEIPRHLFSFPLATGQKRRWCIIKPLWADLARQMYIMDIDYASYEQYLQFEQWSTFSWFVIWFCEVSMKLHGLIMNTSCIPISYY